MRLSHSAIETWKQCQAKYKHHYLSKLRSELIPTALLFGSSVDEALNVLLLRKKKITAKDKEELEKIKQKADMVLLAHGKDPLDIEDPVQIFEYFLTYKEIKKDIGPEDISNSQYLDCYKSDFEPGVLFEEDLFDLQVYMIMSGYHQIEDPTLLQSGLTKVETEQGTEEIEDKARLKKVLKGYLKARGDEIDPIELYEDLKDREKEEPQAISLTDKCFMNYCCWISLKRKGQLMIELYEREILPKIKKVHSIQKMVNLPNEEGDSLIGFIDLEAEFEPFREGIEEGVYTVDNKTSSGKFKVADIHDKGQLLIYDEWTQNGKAAYIVLQKKPKFINHKQCEDCGFTPEAGTRKRKCPECGGSLETVEVEPFIDYDILVDNINEERKDLHFEEISGIIEEIKEVTEDGYFPQNRDSCYSYGKMCPYFHLCRNGSMKGLVKK